MSSISRKRLFQKLNELEITSSVQDTQMKIDEACNETYEKPVPMNFTSANHESMQKSTEVNEPGLSCIVHDMSILDEPEEKEKEEGEDDVKEEEYQHRIRTMEYPPLPSNILNALKNKYEKVKEKEIATERSKILRSKLEVYSGGSDHKICLGDQRLKTVFHLLNNMGYTRSPDQVLFHDSYIHACLPLIYGEEWPKNSVRVMRTFRLKKLEQLVLVLTPRRIGKTVSVAMFVAAILLAVPGIEIAVFSTCQRASTAIMKLVLKMLTRVPGSDRRILGKNKETLYVSATPLPIGIGPNSAIAKKMVNSPSVSTLNCFPASENSKLYSVFSFHFLTIPLFHPHLIH